MYKILLVSNLSNLLISPELRERLHHLITLAEQLNLGVQYQPYLDCETYYRLTCLDEQGKFSTPASHGMPISDTSLTTAITLLTFALEAKNRFQQDYIQHHLAKLEERVTQLENRVAPSPPAKDTPASKSP